MFLNRGYKFNRFGEEVEEVITDSKLNQKIKELEGEFTKGARTMFDKLKTDLLDRAKAQVEFEPNYITVKGKRIVSLAKSKDKNDAVTRDELDIVERKIKGVLKGLEVTDECIRIKGNRRLCNISKAKDQYDAVNNLQMLELINKLTEFQNQINNSLATLQNELKIKK